MISVLLALSSRTPAEAARPRIRGQCIAWSACLLPQLSLVLINRPRRDGTLSWRWYTAAVGGIRTHDLAIASPEPYHSAIDTQLSGDLCGVLAICPKWITVYYILNMHWCHVQMVLSTQLRYEPVPQYHLTCWIIPRLSSRLARLVFLRLLSSLHRQMIILPKLPPRPSQVGYTPCSNIVFTWHFVTNI